MVIYIPVWLDQKYEKNRVPDDFNHHLHSSMVRLEIGNGVYLKQSCTCIYIPVWLDQKYHERPKNMLSMIDLHSSMVRLEMSMKYGIRTFTNKFTFQYGQIRNSCEN